MATVNKRIEALEQATRKAAELVTLINVTMGDDGQVQSTREHLTPAEYRARFGEDPSAEPLSVKVVW